MRFTNKEVRQRACTCIISERIGRRRWRWIGHALRVDHQQNPRIALTWALEGKKSGGRPREARRKAVEGERQKMGFATSNKAVAAERDKADWRGLANGPILL